ncbi:glutamate--cysteine ligase [Mycolicibacterium flavescens]|uniref:Putative glutamate--cysteine ligase 2 n=1 Tax=Mycolicibacterium flavescens TaxID=1776 RepID=A0A1E3RDW3_MYCFV|nr:glutamate--cysteine ligase [Mycolicibacterium flavescens]MCV7280728.1 glutamate--cysteine ligase [Mycolicibacterium flavescens]ODQ88076.1 carboxylate--amine ligase [Mycolicibacterium flavescens]
MATHPTIGVEEEFLLVDSASGEPVARNETVAREAAARGVKLQLELTTCQVETATEAVGSAIALQQQLIALRRATAEAAEQAGAQLLAVGLPPTLPHEFPITDTPRYRRIAERFGMIAHEQGICGCHVHVAVPSREIAVRVSNRLRPWLPSLLGLSANSAIYRNSDTGHASWRSVLWARWPSAGPPPHFDSVDEYDAVVQMMQQAGAMLDDGMVYWDVRPSANFPTIEVRVADVPATVADTVLLAALTRAAVMTALDDERRGEPVPPLAPHALKAAYWKSARDGIDGDAVDLVDGHARVPAGELLGRLVEHVRPALEDVGDYDLVVDGLRRVTEAGNGASRQRRAWQRGHDVGDVVAAAAEATLEGC